MCLEILPCKVIVFRFRSVSRQDIAQNILFSGEITQIFVQPYCPVAGSGNLVAFQIQELVARHIVRQDIAAFRLQHGREYDAMEYDVVLADEMYKACFGVFPPRLPRVGKQLFGIADVADGSIEPNIKHFSFRTFHRHGDSPIKVTAHGTGLQSHVEPALALSVHVIAPFLMAFQNPFAQPRFVFVKRQVPVFGLSHDGLRTADGTLRINQFGRRERCATFLALVSVCSFGMAMRAFAGNVTVGQESLRFLIVILHGCLFHELPFVVELAEKVRCRLCMHFRSRTSVYIKRDAELLERVLDKRMITVYHILWGDAFFLGTDGNGHAMLIRPADKKHVFFLQTKVTHINIRRHIHACKMADMHGTVGIRQGRCHGGSFEFLLHCVYI